MDPEEKEDDIVVVEEQDEEIKDPGELDSTKEEVKQLKKPVKKRGNDRDKRMNELWLQRKEAEAIANREMQEKLAERAKNKEYEAITASALEENLNTKRELLREKMIRAKEKEDVRAEAELSVELSKVEAQSAQIERYKIENKVESRPVPQQQQVREEESQPLAYGDLYDRQNKFGKEWMDRNSEWYNNESEEFDEDKVADVTYFAQSLEQRFNSTGQGFPPGSKGYFKELDNYIKQNWDDEATVTEEAEEKPTAQATQKNYAAPVGNRGTVPNQPGARKEYKITQAEKDVALAMRGKGKDGRPLSDAEKIKRFISLREGIPESGPISMRTIKK